MPLESFIPAFLAYVLACRLTVRHLDGTLREFVFAALNILGFYWFCLHGQNDHFNVMFVAYLLAVWFQYLALRLFCKPSGYQPWIAFFTPILLLIMVRYSTVCFPPLEVYLHKKLQLPLAAYLPGISYLAFRSSWLVLEVRNGTVKRPGLLEYFGFCFFVPTVPVGPINPYGNFRRGFESDAPVIPIGRASLRIIVGLVKYLFLGSIFSRLTYDGFLLDQHPHHWIDLPLAAIFYYLFLYCNFSGFCDAAIGAAGLMGIPVMENFNNPFAARNVKDFWNRWHITLSTYMRNVVFSPLSKFLARHAGPANINHVLALTIIVVFLLVGIWHGVGWNFAAFGMVHALGVVTNHYYSLGLKKWLGREGLNRYNSSKIIHACAVVLTFGYVAASLFFFANTFPEMKEIFASLRADP